jgi:hypothetical protein
MSKNGYTIDRLLEIVARDNAKLYDDNKKYEGLGRYSKVEFICSCGEPHIKSFDSIYKYGGCFCKKCGIKNASEKAKKTFVEKYGVDNPSRSNIIKEKRDKTNLERRGVLNPFADKEVQEKIKATNLEKRGVEYAASDPEIIKQRKETVREKYGCDYTLQNKEVREKAAATILERYGVENISQNEVIKEKKRTTTLSNYGTEYPAQTAKIVLKMVKTMNKYKDITTPSGKTIQLQGYEPQAYKMLLESYNENEIVNHIEDVPCIWWTCDEGRLHRYFVDFYIPKDNLLVEIKSKRTYNIALNKNKLQSIFKQCVKEGYNIEVWIISDNGEMYKKITKYEDIQPLSTPSSNTNTI